MEIMKNRMTYTPTAKDPVLVFRNGGFGFNPLNRSSVAGFLMNVRKCRNLRKRIQNSNNP